MAPINTEIPPATSARICSHMNDDHAVTIHAMVLSRKAARGKVQNAKMTSISTKGYSISYVLCDGDSCAMKEITIPFNPPLNSPAEAKSRLVRDHHEAFDPKFSWLVTDPLMRALFWPCVLLGVGTALGKDELTNWVDGTPWVSAFITAVCGTPTRFAKFVVGAFYFAIVAHSLEACYTAYLCKSLKMKTGAIFKWALLNVCTGFPAMSKVLELVAVDSDSRSKNKSK